MRESISVTTIFQIVIIFILLFTAIMALTINNSNAFAVKNSLIRVIEQKNGLIYDGDSLDQDIVDTLAEASYRSTGSCSDGYTGYDRNGNVVYNNAAICIRKVEATSEIDSYIAGELGDKVATGDFINGIYYQIEVFFHLDLPLVNSTVKSFNFRSKGETRLIYVYGA
jgi:hypothetical protein